MEPILPYCARPIRKQTGQRKYPVIGDFCGELQMPTGVNAGDSAGVWSGLCGFKNALLLEQTGHMDSLIGVRFSEISHLCV